MLDSSNGNTGLLRNSAYPTVQPLKPMEVIKMSELIDFLMGVFFTLLIVDIVLALMYLMKKKLKKKIPKDVPKQETKLVKEKKDI